MQRPLTPAELIADGIVHVVGLLLALAAGAVLLLGTTPDASIAEFSSLVLYLGSLVGVLSISMAYNLWPVSPIKMHLARLDQAAIFLFIAGTYTPFLAVLGGTPMGILMTTFVWGASLIGIALKLFVPQRFGRLAIALYLAIGWSGVFVFHSLAATLPASTMGLLLAGGIVYSLGVVFHLWEQLKFQNALWHVFVVVGASLHLLAIINFIVLDHP
ncbi:hemolysin III family protein [Devosia algicola]|uniref:Hemolysin III family protein n=1 Tax=Devosia algicola TaxID=3026418 RepID=A0ABY7YR56_9HYPH|nr:hemolysin III family protein [Devosia algicola]WDR03667.1 hemolysin III family protein [Devosia algicola]